MFPQGLDRFAAPLRALAGRPPGARKQQGGGRHAVGCRTARIGAAGRHVARPWRDRPACGGEGDDPLAVADRRGRVLRRGLFISEVWFGWATQEELQPNIDGLSFDEVLLLGLVPGIVTVLITRYVTRRARRRSTDAALKRPGPHRSRPTSGACDLRSSAKVQRSHSRPGAIGFPSHSVSGGAVGTRSWRMRFPARGR